MQTFSSTFNTFIWSTLWTMLGSKKSSNRRIPTMSLRFKSFFQHFTARFLKLMFVYTATYFQDATRPDLELTRIHTLSKDLSYLWTCKLREPMGSRTILIYFKTTTYSVGQLGRLPPCQNIVASCPNAFLPSV